MPHESILIVDDQPVDAKLIQRVLDDEGYEVTIAANAPEALQGVKDSKPDLILMDIHLPGMGGIELTKFLKSNPESWHIKIIAISAYASTEDQQRAITTVCDGYIAKPIDIRTFASSIREYLNK
jgi:two-component system cell cycle response regulator DivK